MSASPNPTFVPTIPAAAAGRGHFRLSLEHYHAMIETGTLTENDRVEFIFGELIDTMSNGEPHASCVNKINLYFVINFGRAYECSPQNPVTIPNQVSEPEPDYALCTLKAERPYTGHPLPQDVHLAVEVADATLKYDRTVKRTLYARAGIKEYWIVNLNDELVEVHLDPDIQEGSYNDVRRYARGAVFTSPLCGEVAVGELLPV